jgi:putative MATE family efflux protein
MVVANVVNQFDMIVDMVWVARLGVTSVAGVAVAGTLVMVLSSARAGLTVGQRAMVSRAVGANDVESANHATMQAFLLNLIYAALTIVAGVILAEPLMKLMGLEPEVVRQGANYMRIMMFSQAAMSFRMMGEASMQASGDSMTPAKIIAVVRVLHVILAPFLIFGWAGLPRLEVSGAALANTLTQTLGAAIAIWVLASGHTRLHMRLTWRFNWVTIWEMIRIGIPAAINSAQRSVARTLITRIVATFGTYSVSAYAIGQRVDQLTEVMSSGIGQAAGVLVGQNLGAGRPDRSYRSAWTAMGFGALASLVIAIFVIWKSPLIVRIFNSDPELVSITSRYQRILSSQFVPMCGAMIFSQALNTAGDTLSTMIASIVTLLGIELPGAYFVPKITGWGVYGVAVATVMSTTVRVILYICFFQWGKWREKKIRFGAGEQMRFGGPRR